MIVESKQSTRPSRPAAGAPDAKAVRAQLERILASPDLASRRSRTLLRHVVAEALAGRGEGLTQGEIATRLFGRGDDFDPALDPIVRIQVGRLRRSLERYYRLSGKQDRLRIELPRGGCVPLFRWASRAETEAVSPASEQGPDEPAVLREKDRVR